MLHTRLVVKCVYTPPPTRTCLCVYSLSRFFLSDLQSDLELDVKIYSSFLCAPAFSLFYCYMYHVLLHVQYVAGVVLLIYHNSLLFCLVKFRKKNICVK